MLSESVAYFGGNPKGIVPSSRGLRACELPWESVGTEPQPRWGCLVRTPWTQGSSFLATLGFDAESLWDSRECAPYWPFEKLSS